MKRILCFALTLMLVLSIPTVSLAGNDNHNYCDAHPNASKVQHDEIDYVNDVDEFVHRKAWCRWNTCSVCDAYIGTGGDVYHEEYEAHAIVGNTCYLCGYRSDKKLTQQELQDEAIQRIAEDGDKIIGKKATVQHVGYLRYAAGKYAASYRQVIEGEEFTIESYTFDDGDVWLEVSVGTTTAWISAGLVEISGKGAGGTGREEVDRLYIGMRCRIIVSSGRARVGIGTDYPIVEYVGYNDEFIIRDIGYADDGTLWFQIQKDGTLCWISSGIATTN